MIISYHFYMKKPSPNGGWFGWFMALGLPWFTMVYHIPRMAHLIQSPDWTLVSWEECCPHGNRFPHFWWQQTSTDSNAQKDRKAIEKQHPTETVVNSMFFRCYWKPRKQSHSSTSSHKAWLFQNSWIALLLINHFINHFIISGIADP